MIESLWKLPTIDSPNVSIRENYDSSAPDTPATEKATVIEPDSTTLVTPPVSLCYAPKKRKVKNMFCHMQKFKINLQSAFNNSEVNKTSPDWIKIDERYRNTAIVIPQTP